MLVDDSTGDSNLNNFKITTTVGTILGGTVTPTSQKVGEVTSYNIKFKATHGLSVDAIINIILPTGIYCVTSLGTPNC